MDDHLSFVAVITLGSLSCETVDLIQRLLHFLHPVVLPAMEVLALAILP